MSTIALVLLIGGAGVAFVCWWVNKGPPEPPSDAGDPKDYGADGP